MYVVNTRQFTGPLDLLLQLAEEEKLDLNELSLAEITAQYLDYLNKLKNIPLEELVGFLLIASRLILIKSRLLLPFLEISPEEEEDLEELKKHLEEYKKIKRLAKHLEALANNKKNFSFRREKLWNFLFFFYPPKNVTSKDIFLAFKKIIEEIGFAEKQISQEKIKIKISIEEKIKFIQEKICQESTIRFNKIIKESKSKIEIIVSFLALLELIKQKIISVQQKENCGDIIITKKQS